MTGRVIGLALVAAPLLAGCATQTRGRAPVADLYAGFSRVDPDRETVTPDSWLVVRDGRVVDMGTGRPPRGPFRAVHDMTGLHAMPGLIDAHAHIVAGPQRVAVRDGARRIEIATGDEYSRINAAVALAFGVTSVRNPGGSATAAARYDAMRAGDQWVGPEARHAGEIVQPPKLMQGESFAYPTTPEQWRAEAARQAAAGMRYFKLYTDLSEEEVAQGAAAARDAGLIPIAHLNRVSWTRAARLGVRQLEHALPTSPDLLEPDARGQYRVGPDFMTRWFELARLDGPLMREMTDTLRARGVVVNPTLLVNELIYFAGDLDSAFPELAGEFPDYMHPDMAALLANYRAMAAVPPEQLARGREVWPKVLAFVKMLHDAGIPLTIGTDGSGGGPTYAHELGNFARAGIPAWSILRMATSGNAALTGFSEAGRIARGMQADIVFLRADPTADVRNVGQVAWVVNDGTAWRPEQLLDIARRIAADARARQEKSARK